MYFRPLPSPLCLIRVETIKYCPGIIIVVLIFEGLHSQLIIETQACMHYKNIEISIIHLNHSPCFMFL